MTISIPRWLAEQFEADPESFIPYVGHISGNVVALTSGSAMARWWWMAPPGSSLMPRQCATPIRIASTPCFARCLTWTRPSASTLSGTGRSLPPQPKAQSSFVQTLMDDYNRVALSGMYTNTWIISVVVHPETTPGSWRMECYLRRKSEPPWCQPKGCCVASKTWCICISTTLSDYKPRRLGTREIEVEPGVMMPVTEIGEALHLIRTGIDQQSSRTRRVAVVGDLHRARGLWPAAFNLNKPGSRASAR